MLDNNKEYSEVSDKDLNINSDYFNLFQNELNLLLDTNKYPNNYQINKENIEFDSTRYDNTELNTDKKNIIIDNNNNNIKIEQIKPLDNKNINLNVNKNKYNSKKNKKKNTNNK